MKEKITITKTEFLMACASATVKMCKGIGEMSDGELDLLSPFYCTAYTMTLAKELFGEEETNGTAE